MAILSIQSHVAYGHAGNMATVFPLQRLGFEVWPVNTVQFSNHSGYESYRGQVFTGAHIAEVIDGIAARGVMPSCQAVLSGYLGDIGLGEAVLSAVQQVRNANSSMLFLCDPVMGDTGRGLFVQVEIPAFLRDHVVPMADIVTPNLFELEILSGDTINTHAHAITAARKLLADGPSIVLITSLRLPDTAEDTIEIMAVCADAVWLIATPFLDFPKTVGGAGDAFAALFLANYLNSNDVAQALEKSAAAIFALLSATQDSGQRELQIIAAQDDIVQPGRKFTATVIGETSGRPLA